MKQISIQALKSQLSAAVAAAEAGDTFIVTRHHEPVARLGPARPAHVHRATIMARGRLKPAVRRGTKGRYLTVLLEDRGDR